MHLAERIKKKNINILYKLLWTMKIIHKQNATIRTKLKPTHSALSLTLLYQKIHSSAS